MARGALIPTSVCSPGAFGPRGPSHSQVALPASSARRPRSSLGWHRVSSWASEPDRLTGSLAHFVPLAKSHLFPCLSHRDRSSVWMAEVEAGWSAWSSCSKNASSPHWPIGQGGARCRSSFCFFFLLPIKKILLAQYIGPTLCTFGATTVRKRNVLIERIWHVHKDIQWNAVHTVGVQLAETDTWRGVEGLWAFPEGAAPFGLRKGGFRERGRGILIDGSGSRATILKTHSGPTSARCFLPLPVYPALRDDQRGNFRPGGGWFTYRQERTWWSQVMSGEGDNERLSFRNTGMISAVLEVLLLTREEYREVVKNTGFGLRPGFGPQLCHTCAV